MNARPLGGETEARAEAFAAMSHDGLATVAAGLLTRCLALQAALRDIVDVDPVDAALDPTRPLRIAEAVLSGSRDGAT